MTPANTPVSDNVSKFSEEVTRRSNAAVMPHFQFWTMTLAGLEWLWSWQYNVMRKIHHAAVMAPCIQVVAVMVA